MLYVLVNGEWIVFHCLIETNIIIIKSRAIGHLKWNIKENKMTVERETNIWIGKRRIIYFASRTQRLEKEVNFSSSCSADYQHWTYLSLLLSLSLSLPMYCPIVNYYTKWTEHKTNLILLFRVFSSLTYSHV